MNTQLVPLYREKNTPDMSVPDLVPGVVSPVTHNLQELRREFQNAWDGTIASLVGKGLKTKD